MKRLSSLALLLLVLLNAEAANGQSLVYVGGEGTAECGAYLEARRQNNEVQSYVYATWVHGFLSGYNMATSGATIRTLPSSNTVLAFLDKHCREHPLNLLVAGAFSLARELGGTRK